MKLLFLCVFAFGCANGVCPGTVHNIIEPIELRVHPNNIAEYGTLLSAANRWNVIFDDEIIKITVSNNNNVFFQALRMTTGGYANSYLSNFILTDYDMYIDPYKNVDQESLVMHEIGHLLGYPHIKGTVMNDMLITGNYVVNEEITQSIECIKRNVYAR